MSKIKCPKCNKEIDSDLTSCPFCGEDLEVKKESDEIVVPKDPGWVNKWKKKALIYKLSLVSGFTAFLIIGTVLLALLINGYGGIVAFFMGFSYFLSFVLLIAFIVEIFIKRFATKTIDGYSIVFYFGVKYNVVVEDELISNKPTQFAYPEKKQFVVTLPNQKVVNVDISSHLKIVKIYEENKL